MQGGAVPARVDKPGPGPDAARIVIEVLMHSLDPIVTAHPLTGAQR